jgi:hypothetical protein
MFLMEDQKNRGFVCKPNYVDWKNCETTGGYGLEVKARLL